MTEQAIGSPVRVSALKYLKPVVFRAVAQLTVFCLCLMSATAINQFETSQKLFSNLGMIEPFLWLGRAMVAVFMTMPLCLALQLVYFRICINSAGHRMFRCNEPLLELFVLPVMIFALWILVLEAGVNLLRGVKISEMKEQFPGLDPFLDWVFKETQRRLPKMIVPTSALLWTFLGSSVLLGAMAWQADSLFLIRCSIAAGTIFASMSGMTIAFSGVAHVNKAKVGDDQPEQVCSSEV